MNATNSETILELGAPEKTVVIENRTNDTLRVPLSDPNKPHTPILDETKLVDDGFGGKCHPPKMYGDPRLPKTLHAKFHDAVLLEIPPRAKIRVPFWALRSLLIVTCDLEKNSFANPRGICKHLDDPEHRKTAKVVAGALVSPEQISVDFLSEGPHPINLDTRLVDNLAEAKLEERMSPGAHRAYGVEKGFIKK